MAEGSVWADPEKSRQAVQEIKELKRWVDPYHAVRKRIDDARALLELAAGESDEEHGRLVAEMLKGRSLEQEAEGIAAQLEALELQNMLRGSDDTRDALLTIHSGAGGTESQDWAEMLMRMYTRWAERHGFKVEVLDLLQGEEAGIKSAEIQISGQYAYGLLKAEKGVHRLVRISPFDQAKRRHTSFASVFVAPEIDESIQIDIKPDEIRTDTYRSGGRGGQHVNTTDSAVRITHIPTGLVASCQNERSQHKNRERAMKMLRSKLYEHELEKKRETTRKIEDSKLDIDFGSQIRSYVLQPYRVIKDHRTKLEVGDVDRILDGDLQPFIRAYLLARRSEQNGKMSGNISPAKQE